MATTSTDFDTTDINMNLHTLEARDQANAANRASIHGHQRRTLEAIFRHPVATNLEWMDVVELVGEIGSMHRRNNDDYDVHVGGKHYLMHRPHTKDLTAPEVVDLRHFLQDAGWSPEAPSEADAHADPAPPTLMVVLDHHGAKIYRIDPVVGDATKHELHPYDPHKFLHHLAQKERSKTLAQHAPEDITFYECIAGAVADGGKILVVSDGNETSGRDQGLSRYLHTHHRQTYQRVVKELTADLSSVTQAQLLALAEQALAPGMSTSVEG